MGRTWQRAAEERGSNLIHEAYEDTRRAALCPSLNLTLRPRDNTPPNSLHGPKRTENRDGAARANGAKERARNECADKDTQYAGDADVAARAAEREERGVVEDLDPGSREHDGGVHLRSDAFADNRLQAQTGGEKAEGRHALWSGPGGVVPSPGC